SAEGGGSGEEDHDVAPEAPVVDVTHIQVEHFEHAEAVAPADLPEAGDPRPDGESAQVTWWIEVDFPLQSRPGADDRHVSAEDVDQLRELVEAQTSQPSSDGSHSGVVVQLEDTVLCGRVFVAEQLTRAQLPVGGVVVVHDHGPELQHGERLAPQADAFLAEQG